MSSSPADQSNHPNHSSQPNHQNHHDQPNHGHDQGHFNLDCIGPRRHDRARLSARFSRRNRHRNWQPSRPSPRFRRPPTASPICAACSGRRSTTTPQKISTRSSGPSSCPTAAFACWWAWPMWTRASTRAPSSTPTRRAKPPRSTPASRSFPCCRPSSLRASPR